MMYCDAVTYLPDDILCKVDRAAMAVSLETRVPFLDHRVAASRRAHSAGDEGARRAGARHPAPACSIATPPRDLFERPKAGFAIPVGDWIKGPLRTWAEELLDPRRCARRLVRRGIVSARWHEHLSGRRNWTAALWTVLMFQAWLREQKVEVAADRQSVRGAGS